jgi:hypothetical protein
VVVQQVVNFASVDLVHGNGDCEVSLVTLPVVYSAVEQVGDRQLLEALHGEGFSGASLSVGKNSDGAGVEYQVEDGADRVVVEVFVAFVLGEGVVELELLVFDVLRDSVHFKFVFVHNHLRIAERNRVDFASGQFLLKDGSFFHADTNFQLVCRGVRLHERNIFPHLLHQGLKLNINFDSHGLVVIFALSSFALHVLHAGSSLLALHLQVFYCVQARALLVEVGLGDPPCAIRGPSWLHLNAVVFLEAVSALAGCAKGGESLLLEVVEDLLAGHLLDLLLFFLVNAVLDQHASLFYSRAARLVNAAITYSSASLRPRPAQARAHRSHPCLKTASPQFVVC